MNYDVRSDPLFSSEIHPEAPRLMAEEMMRIFDSPDRWTQNAFARDAYGVKTATSSPDAVCFCLRGSLDRARDNLGLSLRDYDRVWSLFEAKTHGITVFNDNPATTFQDIVAVVQQVIDDSRN